MIEKNYNVIQDPSISRTVNYDGNERQITILDQRFYSRKEKFYPSVTYILSFIPKNKIFIDWLKEKGDNADAITSKAAERGKQVHNTIEKYLKGEEIKWIDKKGEARFSLDVWRMILRFDEFWKKYKPKLVGSEIHVFSDKHEYAGTIDLILELEDELWVIDIKTSKQIPRVYHFQTASYATAWNECFDKPVTRRGILWLNSSTRRESSKQMQGRGWSLIESNKSLDQDFESFMLAYSMFKHEVEEFKPYSEILPTSVKL